MFFFSSSDQTTTSTTAIDVPNFTLPLTVAAEVWAFEFQLIIGSSDVNGLKIALTVPQGTQFRAWAVGSSSAKNALAPDLMQSSGVLGVAFNTFAATGNYLSIRGGLQVGTFGGNLQLQAAKVTSGTATLSAGSFLICTLL